MSSGPQLQALVDIVRDVGKRALGGGVQGQTVSIKRDGSFVTAVDVRIQEELHTTLGEQWAEIPLMGEEMSRDDHHEVLHSDSPRFWVLDPLDGTTNFASGLPFYGISLALMEQGVPVLGVVYDPNRDECFAAAAGQGASLNGAPLHTTNNAETSHCIACVDFKRLARTLAEHLVAGPPYKSQRNLGACVLEWCWLAADRFQLYLHGGQRLWDYAAGSLILREAGGSAVTLEGVPIPDADGSQYRAGKVSVVAATNPELLEDWRSWITDRADLYTMLMRG